MVLYESVSLWWHVDQSFCQTATLSQANDPVDTVMRFVWACVSRKGDSCRDGVGESYDFGVGADATSLKHRKLDEKSVEEKSKSCHRVEAAEKNKMYLCYVITKLLWNILQIYLTVEVPFNYSVLRLQDLNFFFLTFECPHTPAVLWFFCTCGKSNREKSVPCWHLMFLELSDA